MKLATAVLSVLMISGCAATPEQIEARKQQEIAYQATIPVCTNETECDAMWDAAQLWIVKNAAYKLQVTTDVLLQTYGSNDTGIAVQVTKEPKGGGEFKIVVLVSCGNPFGCVPDARKKAAEFNSAVAKAL